VLIVFLLGTTFLTTMLDVLYEPTMLIQLLANSLPQGANFFLNYVLFNATTHAMELVQLGSQLFGHLFFTLPFISCTPRMRMQRTQPWPFPYYYYYPNHILVLVITVTYSVIQPLILIFALFYFTFALLVFRHQFMYCYIRRYETRGSRHYRRIVRYTSDGLLIFQLTMVGLLYLKGILPAATALLPLIIFTVYAKIKFNRLFRSKSKHPYVGKFSSEMARKKRPASYWQVIDDVWKFSYIKEWWQCGRYAPSESEEEKPCHELVVDMSHDVKTINSLSLYPDDARSELESYQHPSLVKPLETDLILPIYPHQRYWDLRQCVLIPLDTLKTYFVEDDDVSSCSKYDI
jgi:hypothetical protein